MGWSFGVALTAGIISFALWNAFVRLGISKSPMTILENTCMQSAASSAGYSTGGTLTSAVAALLLLTGQHHASWHYLRLDIFHCRTGCHHGHSDETPDDQH